MARRTPLHPTGAAQRLVRYLQSGRVLRRRMYAATPIPFLRRFHLIPEQAHFIGLSSNLPAWWAADPRFAPGFEFHSTVASAVDEWADDSAPRRADVRTVDQAGDQVGNQSPEVAAPSDRERLAEFSRRGEPVAPSTPLVSDVPPPRRAFFRPVLPQNVARPVAARRARAAVSVTRSEQPVVAPPTDNSTHTSLPRHPRPVEERVPSGFATDGAHTLTHTTPAELEREHSSLDNEPSISQVAPDERVSPIPVPPIAATHDVSVDDAIPARPAVAPERLSPPPAAVQSEFPLSTDPTPAIARSAQRTEDADSAQPEPSDDPQASETTLPEASGETQSIAESPAVVPATARRRARVEELPIDRLPASAIDSRESATSAPNSRRADPPSRPPAAPEPPREREGDRLFRPIEDGVDRSPTVWAARLARAMRAPAAGLSRSAPPARATESGTVASRRPVRPQVSAPTRLPSTPTPSASPTPAPLSRPAASEVSEVNVSERARRFLKPLVGIDPATVTIVQGPAADDINAAHQTDALAIGDDTIVVGSAFTGELPRDLGLLAHELTHIARERRPRFIPPAARSRRGGTPTQPGEEALARRVEARAIALANDGAAQKAVTGRLFHEASQQNPPATIEATLVDEAQMSHAARPVNEWGGLPPPWEPLPEWLAEPATDSQRSFAVNAVPVASSLAPMPIATSAPAIQAAVHAADSARVIDAPERAAAPGAGEGQQPVPPDIDRLARQVYAALKRRLEADARRERMFRG